MTVKEFMNMLKKLPEETPVYVRDTQAKNANDYGSVDRILFEQSNTLSPAVVLKVDIEKE